MSLDVLQFMIHYDIITINKNRKIKREGREGGYLTLHCCFVSCIHLPASPPFETITCSNMYILKSKKNHKQYKLKKNKTKKNKKMKNLMTTRLHTSPHLTKETNKGKDRKERKEKKKEE